jgi:alpha-galactosidase
MTDLPPTVIAVDTPNSSLVFMADRAGLLFHRYFGEHLRAPEAVADFVFDDERRYATFEAPSTFGGCYAGEPALAVTHADGNMTTDLRYLDHEYIQIDENIIETRIRMKDAFYSFFATFIYRAYQAEDMITSKVVFKNEEDGPVVLKHFASFDLVMDEPAYWLSHFHGDWSVEMRMEEEKLGHGVRILDSKKGVRTSQHDNASFMLSLGESVSEEAGAVIGGALAWSGNYRICFEQDARNILHMSAGINPFESAYSLESTKFFETPEFIFTYSASGKGTVSRRFHRWARRYALRAGETTRPVLLNGWEGVYFDFDEDKLAGMMDHAAELGCEMFVLDDGWFGNKYPRNDTTAGLGDWQVNRKKLPRGLDHLTRYAEKKGLRFGLWMEPEMVNPQSELAETHPDWIVQRPNREQLLFRNQLLLDLSNPAVQDFVFKSVNDILTDHSQIAYIKWDCNRHVWNFGSSWLSSEEQSHWWIHYTRGLYSVYARLMEKHPDVLFQACGSGGGRVDYGLLPYHHEFWPSDNTDAFERIFIQWGTSHFYPAIAMAAHVSAVPNHQTGNILPLKFRFDVAMTGRLGLELAPPDMTDEELGFAKACVATYKRIRNVIQFGDLYRLISPYQDGNKAALMYVSAEKDHAVAFLYVLRYRTRFDFPILKLRGLDPQKEYRVVELNKDTALSSCLADGKSYAGDFLMKYGLQVQIRKPHQSVVLEIVEIVDGAV